MVRESVACQSCQAEMKLPYPTRACECSDIGIGLIKKMSDLQSSGGPCICAFGFYEAVRKKRLKKRGYLSNRLQECSVMCKESAPKE